MKDTLEKLAGSYNGRPRAPYGDGNGFSFDAVLIVRLIAACLLFAASLLLRKIPAPWPLVMLAASALIAGADIIAGGVLAVMDGRYFDRCVIIPVAAIIAFIIGLPSEAAALVLLFQIGGIFIEYAVCRTRESVIDAVSPDALTAVVERDGEPVEISPEQVNIGDVILLSDGGVVPCDCIVIEGSAAVDASPIGGAGEPAAVSDGDELFAGSVCRGGPLRCEATAVMADSAAAMLTRALRSGECESSKPPKLFSSAIGVFSSVLVIVSVLIAGIIPLIYKLEISESVRRALVFLVAADPCALLAALPVIRFCAAGGAVQEGVLFRSAKALDSAAQVGAVAFERSGALTDGSLRVSAVKAEDPMDAELLLKVTAHAMAYSSNPCAKSIIGAYGGSIYIELVKRFSETPEGVEVYVDDVRICAGTPAFIASRGVTIPEPEVSEDTAIYVSVSDRYAGRIMLTDSPRPDASAAVSQLERQKVGAVVMFSEEPATATAAFASDLGIREYYSLSSRDKTLSVLGGIREGLSSGDSLMFVYGGDAPASHSSADIDAAMCELPNLPSAAEADVAIINGEVSGVALAIGRAAFAHRLMYMTMGGAALIKLILMVLAFFGLSPVWFAVFIDSAAAVGTILASIFAFNGSFRR